MKKIQCTTEEVYRNKKTNVVYASKKDAEHDVKVIVPPEALSLISDTKK
jgi:hypothetical protein